jgi:hypothetical protein
VGYRHFDLTPCTGDVFMDRGIFRKLEHLESVTAVEGYSFHTNFTIPRARDIKRLFDLRKLSGFLISIYGYHAETFVDITQSTEKVYRSPDSGHFSAPQRTSTWGRLCCKSRRHLVRSPKTGNIRIRRGEFLDQTSPIRP